jgi:hypothetical protein
MVYSFIKARSGKTGSYLLGMQARNRGGVYGAP